MKERKKTQKKSYEEDKSSKWKILFFKRKKKLGNSTREEHCLGK